MLIQESTIHSHISPRHVASFDGFKAEDYLKLRKIGIHLEPRRVRAMMDHINDLRKTAAMDALQPTVTTASIPTPVQFLQAWLPGFVHVITAALNIDLFVGITTAGAWEDQEIVQAIMELVGDAIPYGDYTNVPFDSWNVNFDRRTIVRFEQGFRVGELETRRAARINVDNAGQKRQGAALQLEIERNRIGFYGYNSGDNLTYGFLNDPALPAYVTFEDGASSEPFWSTKTYLEIVKDLLTMYAELRTQSKDRINPKKDKITLGLATAVVDFLSTSTDFGYTVQQWINENYPNTRVVSAPELDGANGGANVAYMYAEEVNDSSTDDRKTFMQNVPTKFMTLGVGQMPKFYEEDFSNASAGVSCKRPWAVVRYSGC